jgi:hypothetical protein
LSADIKTLALISASWHQTHHNDRKLLQISGHNIQLSVLLKPRPLNLEATANENCANDQTIWNKWNLLASGAKKERTQRNCAGERIKGTAPYS